RRGDRGAPASERVRGPGTKSPDQYWRRRPDLNRGWRFCRPLPYRLATAPHKRQTAGLATRPAEPGEKKMLERETGFEPATSTLARSHSTTELFPPEPPKYHTAGSAFKFAAALRAAPSPLLPATSG